MIGTVTQENLYLLLPSKISWLADMLSYDKGISITEAIKQIYASEVYKKLEREDTKWWHLGAVDLYNALQE